MASVPAKAATKWMRKARSGAPRILAYWGTLGAHRGRSAALHAIQTRTGLRGDWWAVTDLNRGPSGCKPDALTAELTAQSLLSLAGSSIRSRTNKVVALCFVRIKSDLAVCVDAYRKRASESSSMELGGTRVGRSTIRLSTFFQTSIMRLRSLSLWKLFRVRFRWRASLQNS